MKTLSFLITAFLVVFFFGCQENSITDPGTIDDNVSAAQNTQQLASKDFLSNYPNIIEIGDRIFDPTHPDNGGSKIKGFIRYDHQLIPHYSTPDNQKYSVKLKLYVNLLIDAKCPINPGLMKVLGFANETIDFYTMDGNSKTVVIKKYPVCETCCGCMCLVLKFKVDKKDLELISMQLRKVSTDIINEDPT